MTELAAVVLALSAAVGAWIATPVPLPLAIGLGVTALLLRRPVLLFLGVALATSTLSARAWDGLHFTEMRQWSGTATLAGDPEEVLGATRVVIRIEGKRVEAWARGGAAGLLRDRLAGERVTLTGRLQPVPSAVRAYLARRHIGARMTVTAAEAWAPGDPATRLANGLRRTLVDGAASLPPERRSLYAGFVLGDDREEPVEIADDFKASGLSHLLVVSGENVAFVLALFAPVLSRLGLRSRLVIGLVVLGLFGVLTRWEPSVMRAEAMAALALVAATIGRPMSSIRLLALAVTAVLLIDPLLVGSVGFLLSVGACTGIALLSAPIAEALPGPRSLASAASVTLGAQVGVAPVLVPVFGSLPVASLPANLLALPAAGPLTIWGLVAGLPAGILGAPVAPLLHVPTDLMVGWVAAVARFSARVPLGELRATHMLVIAVVLVTWWWARSHHSARTLRWCAVAAGAVVMAAAVPALHPTDMAGKEVAEGARLWRQGGTTVFVVEGRPSPERLLDAMHKESVRHLDILVVTRPGVMAARSVTPLLSRYPARLLLAPESDRLKRAVVPEMGSGYRAGQLVVTVGAIRPGLAVTVRSGR
ncbi:MAG TPA: ComEC/Rec2 family competence protein [Acidimicrobiales bacterium]|nr:ComEC/Rec2 family competence protein [Acidimicrobiales bacterium]